MGKKSETPTIRILILGAPGVGKGCLESRFTTTTYPPPYDTSLTVNSRRFLTLSPPSLPEEFSAGLPAQTQTLLSPRLSAPRRPSSASTTISNPASEHRTSSALDEPPTSPQALLASPTAPIFPPKLTLQTNPLPSPPHPAAPPTPLTPSTSTPSPQTFLVELTNYPLLQSPRHRAQILTKTTYDAVLLVYDITSRDSFRVISSLHSEIPIAHRNRKRRRSFFQTHSPTHQRKGSSAEGGGGGGLDEIFSSSSGGGVGERETVIALVGNKCDVDCLDFGGEIDLGYPLVEKEAVMQEAEVEERGLVHPLFRESMVLFDEEPQREPLRSPRSVRSVPVRRARRWDGEEGQGRTRSVVSEGAGVRGSVFSVAKRGELSLVREDEDRAVEDGGRRQEMPPTPPDEGMAAIEKWLEVDGGTYERKDGGEDADVDTAAPKREVSRFEGEMLARTLLLNMPFRETSAKTGENVEEIFEAIVREVLWEMGKETGVSPLEPRPATRDDKKEVPALGRKKSVLRKERKPEANGQTMESATSDRPPVLTLSGLEEPRKAVIKETAEKVVVKTEPEAPTKQPLEAPRLRRESILGNFFRRVFGKKAPSPSIAV